MSVNFLAIDIGTSSVHCIVTDHRCNPLVSKDGPIRYYSPQTASDLTLEFSPEELLDTVGALIVEAMEEVGITKGDIKALAITSQRQGIVLLDAIGKELFVSPNIDLRAVLEGTILLEEFGPTLYTSTGQHPPLLCAYSRMRWLLHNKPKVFDRKKTLLTLGGWLTFRLTGEIVCEPSLAAGIGMLDLETARRDTDLLNRMNFPKSTLPPLKESGEVVGHLLLQPASSWGLEPGTPVALAGADSQCSLIGMGLINPGDIGLVTGWSCTIQMITRTLCYDNKMRTWVGFYPIQPFRVAEVNLGDVGNAHLWLKNTLFDKNISYDTADMLASSVTVGSDNTRSYLGCGPISAPSAGLRRGGILFPTPMRYHKPKAGEIWRAFWEGFAYSVKANLDTLKEVTGHNPEILYLGGGMGQSKLMAQTIASVLDSNVRRSKLVQTSGRGASVSAAVAAGFYDNMDECVRSLPPMWEEVEPNPSDALEYQGYFSEWKDLYYNLQDSNVDEH